MEIQVVVLVWQSFVWRLAQLVTSKLSFNFSSLATAEGCWVALVLQRACLSIPTCLSLPKLSGASLTNLSGRWGGWLFTCHLRDAQATQSVAHNAACLNPVKSKQRIDAATCTEQILWRISAYLPVCVYLLPGSFGKTLHLLFIPWNKAGPWQEQRLRTQTLSNAYTHTNGPPSVAEKSAIMEREGRDSWDLHMSLREGTTSPTRPGGGNEPAVHGL